LGRPEDINYSRPTLSLSPDNPGITSFNLCHINETQFNSLKGSDMFGEMAAALAAASVALKGHWEGPQLSENYLKQARRLFEMAIENRGDYLRAMQLLTWHQVYM